MRRRLWAFLLILAVGIGVLLWGIRIFGGSRKGVEEEEISLKSLEEEVEKSSAPRLNKLSDLDKVIEEGRRDVLDEALNLTKKLIQENKLLEAKQVYKKLITSFPNSPKIPEIEKKLWAVNMKILFSPLKTDYSLIYEVKPGDTLLQIARKFNTTVELIKKSNGLDSDLIRPGQRLKVLNAKVSIIVDKSQNKLSLKINDEIFKVYPCSTGEFNSTPSGKFKIVNKLIDPVWYKAGAVVPPDSPENILGSRWMGLDIKGYGIHGTTQPETVGKQITAGCVRMYDEDVKELYSIVPLGTEVTIID